MAGPRVAIVVRTKDRPWFLARALRSICAQTLVDWECVIVNDGGNAAAVDELVDSLPADQRDRVRTIHSAASRGRWVSANSGVLATSAPYLVLHDDDDTWHPEFLSRAVAQLETHPEQDAALSRIEIIWEERRDEGYAPVGRELFQPHLREALLADALLYNRFVPIGFVYRRSLHEELGLYDADLSVVGDWNFYLRFLGRGPLPYLADEPYAYWHQRRGAEGSAGNSVIAAGSDHASTDARLRDRALREYIDENGYGLVLYLTKFIDRRFIDVEEGIRAEIAALRPELAELHPTAVARRAMNRLIPRG